MNPVKIVTISLLALAIAACGGGGSPTSKVAEVEATEKIVEAVTVGTPDIGLGTASAFQSGELQLELSTISAGGVSNITASVVDITKNNELINSTPYSVVFNSSCADKTPAKATFSAINNTVTTKTGNVSIAYTATGCTGVDLITASLYELDSLSTVLASAKAEIIVEEPAFGSIAFVSNSESVLSFTGIANSVLKSSNLVTFIVTDTFGNPIENVDVSFALSSQSAGVTASLSSVNAATNADGFVSTTMNSGTTHGVLSVIATTVITPDVTKPNETVTKISSSLPVSVSTGIAVQSNFSLSANNYNLNAYSVDGVEVEITARLADRYGNPVPAGTIVNFSAESGSIPSSCATDLGGACSVDWRSQGTRPGDFHSNFSGTKNSEYLPVEPVTNPLTFSMQSGIKGFTTITAYAIGEAGFIEKNSNGIYDIGEKFETYPEVFRNDNGNFIAGGPVYDNEEEFFEFIQDGVYSAAPTVYQGSLCSVEASNAGHCVSNMYVNESIRIVQAEGGEPYQVRFYRRIGNSYTLLTNTDVFDVTNDGELYVLVADINGNVPGSGNIISFSAFNCEEIATKTVSLSESQYIDVEGFPVNRGLLHSFAITPFAAGTLTTIEVQIANKEGVAKLNLTR